jgi:AraC-like DNA-binding protein
MPEPLSKHAANHPPLMKFKVPEELKSETSISDQLPKDYERYRVPGSIAEFISGPFGCYFTQEIRQKDWVIGWLNFDIKEQVYLYPVTAAPFIGLYCGLKGNIPCELHGSEAKLILPEESFGFYYVPQNVMNKADFEPFHYTGVYMSFTSDFLQKFGANNPRFTSLIEKQVKRVMEGEQVDVISLSPEAHSLIRTMKLREANDPHFMLFQDVKVNELMLLYFELLRAAQHVPAPIQRVLDFIAEYYDTPISLEELVQKSGLEEKAFKRQFKAVTGMMPDRYIKNFRAEKAKHLLLTTDLSINDIALKTGFTDNAHMTRTFRHKYKMTPTEFRAQRS